jgi:hypothetical protein
MIDIVTAKTVTEEVAGSQIDSLPPPKGTPIPWIQFAAGLMRGVPDIIRFQTHKKEVTKI